MSDVLLQKKSSIDRCIKQARDYYAMPSEKPFSDDYLKQDAIITNLQRACEQCIDMANHVVRVKKLGLPSTSADSFVLLREAGLIDRVMEKKLIGMAGFRNILVHQYRSIDYQQVEDVINRYLDDLIEFAGMMVAGSK